jgi:hypothetical protein
VSVRGEPMNSLRAFFIKNKKVIQLTFEIFWILVFVLEMVANRTSSSIPQFVYVNF